jgi:hypothetical protein
LTFDAMSTTATTLFLRHGGQLSSEPPSMEAISPEEMDAAMALHAETQYFHSDFAHTDYIGIDPANRTATSAPGSASWSTAPLASACTLQPSRAIMVVLWIGSNAVESEFTASLSRGTASGEWLSLCGATGNTLYREGPENPLPLPGKVMVAASANGGFSVALSLHMQLEHAVELQASDVLRIDVSCGERSAAEAHERVDQRVWHNPKWPSTIEFQVAGGAALELPFEPHPVITQPGEGKL